jgi:hypothetical protein
MRSIRFLAVVTLFGCMTCAAASSSPAAGRAGRVTMTIPSGAYRIIAGDDGDRIVMEEYGRRMEPGKPMLPEKEIMIALPPGARVRRADVHGIGATPLPGFFRIAPAPPIVPLAGQPLRRKLAEAMHREWSENYEAAYSADDAYPEESGRITCAGSLRKYAYASVSVCPFSYRPRGSCVTARPTERHRSFSSTTNW